MTRFIIALACAVASAVPAVAAVDPLEELVPSFVQVEFMLRYDGGQPPRTPGWAERCPSCGRYHVQPGAGYVEDERPMEAAGYLISPTKVVTGDFFLQSRFIESIRVRLGDEVVTARPVAHAVEHYAMMLELDQPLAGARPLSFTNEGEPPYRSAHWQHTDAEWTLEVKGVSLDAVIMTADGARRFSPMPARGLVIDRTGAPVGLAMNQTLPADGSWKGSPEQWEWVAREELEVLFDTTASMSAGILPRVELEFRRGRPGASAMDYYREDDRSITERQAIGVMVSEDTMLVLASLDARNTARLERMTVHLPDGQRVGGHFVGSLRDYGALIIRLDEPQAYAADFDRAPIQRLGQRLLVAGEIELHGRNRITRFGHTRIGAYDHGWRRHVYPDLPGDTDNLFLFDLDGTLIAMPVIRRMPGTERRRYSQEQPTLTAAAQLIAVLDDLDGHLDPVNVPLSEEEELRLAWLGVEMQSLDEELARLYNVSEMTRDGRTGALVSYVYADSPAAAAGVRDGDLLLRMHSDARPRPIDVSAAEDPFAYWGGFPWDQYDDMPEEYYDEIPPPWPTADNTVNRALRDLGFGAVVRLEVFRDGEVMMLDMHVVQSPAHYAAAARHRDEVTGLTMQDMTYEVRRYFQKDADAAGLVISGIETGSRASVAGLKPYEIVTHINDEPLHTVRDFERLLAEHTDLRLNVERMHRTRTVRLSRPASPAAPAALSADEPANDAGDDPQ